MHCPRKLFCILSDALHWADIKWGDIMIVFVVGTVVSKHCEMQVFEAASAGNAAICTPGLLAVQLTCNPLVRTSRRIQRV